MHIDPKFINNGPFKDTVTVKIAVEDADEPPMFLAPSYIHEVQENAAAGTVVGRVHAKDPDAANSPIRYREIYFKSLDEELPRQEVFGKPGRNQKPHPSVSKGPKIIRSDAV